MTLKFEFEFLCVCVLQCYNPQACLQMKEDWNVKAKLAFKDRATRQQR